MARLSAPVSPPLLQEPLVSLLRAANNPLQNGGDETNGRWVSGITYQPYENTVPTVADYCDETSTDSPPNPPGAVEWIPYLIRVSDVCSTLGYKAHNFKQRLDTAMRVGRHKAIEKEFWGGALTQAVGTGNAYLTETGSGLQDISPGTGVSVATAMQKLEQALADCGLGGRGMIHIRPEVLPLTTQVIRDGNTLITPRGTIVVVGTGYPATGPGGTAPAAGSSYLFATGMVDVRIDTDNINYYTLDPMGRAHGGNGDFSDEDIITNTNRQTNLVKTRAEMFALASWDLQCWFACKANLGT